MTTSTLDLIDWDTCLDDEPACEWVNGCDHVATLNIRPACGCAWLGCQPHRIQLERSVIECLRRGPQFECSDCGHQWIAKSVCEVFTVIPL